MLCNYILRWVYYLYSILIWNICLICAHAIPNHADVVHVFMYMLYMRQNWDYKPPASGLFHLHLFTLVLLSSLFVCNCNKLTMMMMMTMTSCRTETETVSWMETAGPFDCCCSHQPVALPSLCLCQGSLWTFWAHDVVFSWFSVLRLRIFEFGVLLFDCFVYRQNVTCLIRFTRYFSLRRWGGQHNHRQT